MLSLNTPKLKKILSSVLRRKELGEEGENLVLDAFSKLFKEIHCNGYEPILIPQIIIPNPNDTEPYSVDLLLIHPFLGLRLFEIKNTEDLSHVREAANQLKNYKNVILNSCKELFEREGIEIPSGFLRNFVKAFLIYPRIPKNMFEEKCKKYPTYNSYRGFLILKDDLIDKEYLTWKITKSNSFDDTALNIKFNQNLLKEIVKLFFPEKELEANLRKLNKKPLITPSGIFFLDLAQIKVVKNYKKGLRIVRGIAGTGKTFLAEELLKSWNGKSLFLLFNQELLNQEKAKLSDYENVEVQSLVSFLSKDILSIQNRRNEELEDFFSKVKEKEELLFKRLKEYKEKNDISLLVIDEAQDFPPFLLNILSKVFGNCVIFIDESQAINLFSTYNIKEAFKDTKLTGRVRNLKTVYRSPNKIFKLAKEFLKFDRSLNRYYREIGEDIDHFESILEGGKVKVLTGGIKNNDFGEFTIGNPNALFVKRAKKAETLRKQGLNAYTYESIKGLEFEKVLLYEVDDYIETIASSRKRDLLWRKLFVATTRAKDEVIFHFKYDRTTPEVRKVIQLIEESKTDPELEKSEEVSLKKNQGEKLSKAVNSSKEIVFSIVKGVIVEVVSRLIVGP